MFLDRIHSAKPPCSPLKRRLGGFWASLTKCYLDLTAKQTIPTFSAPLMPSSRKAIAALLFSFSILLLAFHQVALAGGNISAIDRGQERGGKTEKDSPKTGKYAIMVGIDSYDDPNVGKITCAVSDAEMIYSILIDPNLGGFKKEQVILLTDKTQKKPTRVNILRSLKEMLNKESDTLLFYYTGHGIELNGQSYLVPRDVEADFPEDRGIPLSMIRDMLARSRAKSKVIIMDACHSGESAAISDETRMGKGYESFLMSQIPNMVILASASKNQIANEDAVQGHGIFSLALAGGLSGEADTNRDGQVTTEELFPYVRDWVQKWVKDYNAPPQDPFTSGYISDKIVLSLTARQPIQVEDTEPPQIILTEPQANAQKSSLDIQAEEHEIRISGFVRDNIKIAQLSVDNEMVPLTEPSARAENVPAGALAFSRLIILPADTSTCTTVIRAFDTSGNVQYLNITFRVPLSPDVIPETVYVPAGVFLMGSNTGRPDEAPQRTVELSSYEISIHEVTNAQFAAFVRETGYLTTAEREMGSYLSSARDFVQDVSWEHPSGSEDNTAGKEEHPVVHVSFYDAVEYCKWLSGRTGRAFHLPSESEWEKAARGKDGRKYPWGGAIDPGKANYTTGSGQTTPTGSYKKGKSRIGCYDMAGNVREWCADWYAMRPEVVYKDPKGPIAGNYKVVKGGSWLSNADMLRASARSDVDPEQTADDLGFRVAVRR